MTVETLPISRARRLFGSGHTAEVVPFKASTAARLRACLDAADQASDPNMRRVWRNHAQAVWTGAASEWPYVPPYTGGDFELDGAATPGFARPVFRLPRLPVGLYLAGVILFCAGVWCGAAAIVWCNS